MGVYTNIQASLLRYCTDFLQNHNLNDKFEVFDFDSHSSINDMPSDKDVIGIGEFSLQEDEKNYYATLYFSVSTTSDDANLKRLRPVVDQLFSQLKVGEALCPIINSESSKIVGNLVVMNGTEVLPVARTTTRPLVMIGVMLGSTLLVPP